MIMPARVFELRKDTDLKRHHFKHVQAVEVRPLPRTGRWLTAGRWVGDPFGWRHFIYLAPETFHGSRRILRQVFSHEAGHNYLNTLTAEIGPNWQKDGRFRAVYQFKKQFENYPKQIRQFGFPLWIMSESYSEFFCEFFAVAVGGYGRKYQHKLKTYVQQNISEATLSEIVGVQIN